MAFALLYVATYSSISAQEFVYPDGDPDIPIGQHVEFLVDSTGSLTPEAVLASKSFRSSDETVPNLGISENTTWFRFVLRNHTSEPKLLLIIPYPDIDRIDLYQSKISGIHIVSTQGQSVAYDEANSARTGEYVFELDAPEDAAVTFLIRIKGHKQVHLPLLVASPIEAASIASRWNLFAGGFLGIMLVMALYNLFVFLSIC